MPRLHSRLQSALLSRTIRLPRTGSACSSQSDHKADVRLVSLSALAQIKEKQIKEKDFPLQVLVRDNNVDQALRVLKKKMQREGIFREMKLRRSYEKPSERKVRERSDALRRARKLARKKAQREGLIPNTRKTADIKKSPRPAFPNPFSTTTR